MLLKAEFAVIAITISQHTNVSFISVNNHLIRQLVQSRSSDPQAAVKAGQSILYSSTVVSITQMQRR